MELFAPGGSVVGWYSLDGDIFGKFHLIAVLQCLTAAEHLLNGGVEEYLC